MTAVRQALTIQRLSLAWNPQPRPSGCAAVSFIPDSTASGVETTVSALESARIVTSGRGRDFPRHCLGTARVRVSI